MFFKSCRNRKKKQVKTCQVGKANERLISTGWEPALPSLCNAAVLGQRM